MITFSNYFMGTKAIFKGCKKPTRSPDYESNSGSQYWYGSNKNGSYVIRFSDHWCRRTALRVDAETIPKSTRECKSIASCQWRIKSNDMRRYNNKRICGKCYLDEFI